MGKTFYYEVEVLAPAVGPNASIGVGLTIKEGPPKDREMVGWTSGWGYHGDDGNRLCGKMKGLPYGPMYLIKRGRRREGGGDRGGDEEVGKCELT
jgi:hypothetical protein